MGMMKRFMIELEEQFFEDAQELVDTIDEYDECLIAVRDVMPCEIESWYTNGGLEDLVMELSVEKPGGPYKRRCQ